MSLLPYFFGPETGCDNIWKKLVFVGWKVADEASEKDIPMGEVDVVILRCFDEFEQDGSSSKIRLFRTLAHLATWQFQV